MSMGKQSKEVWSSVSTNKSGRNVFMSIPKYSTRNLTIATKVGDVLEDYEHIKCKNHKPKYVKREMLPPLTAAYLLSRDIRVADSIQAKLKKEISICELNDVERQRLLNEVLEKCEAMKTAFRESELLYAQLGEEQRNHQELLKAAAKEKKLHKIAMKRYLKAGECLMELWEIMQDAIKDNSCYYDFMDQISDGCGSGDIISRFERNISIKKELSQLVNEALEKTEKMKMDLMKKREEWERDLVFEMERLQAMHYDTRSCYFRATRYENVLNNLSVVSIAHQTDLNLVLKSVEQMIENLIERKVIGKSYRKKTLAQQIEAIRDDYVKRKAVIREYEKSKEILAQKKRRRLELYAEFSDAVLVSDGQSLRLKDLYEKKKITAAKIVYSQYIKMQKRTASLAESEEEVLKPLEFQWTEGSRSLIRMAPNTTDNDDYDDDDDDDDELDISMYGCTSDFDSTLDDSETTTVSILSANGFSRPSLASGDMESSSRTESIQGRESLQSFGALGKFRSFLQMKRKTYRAK